MASTELTHAAPRRIRSQNGAAAAVLATYGAVWATTLAAAGLVAAAGVTGTVRGALKLTLTPTQNPPPTVAHILALVAHNLPIAAWPLLLGLPNLTRGRFARRGADSLVTCCALANALPVGAALGAYGTRLIPYIPQLPLEWAALAVGYGSWVLQRRRAISGRERLAWLARIAALVLAAATIETVGVPHRRIDETSGAGSIEPVHETSVHSARLFSREHRLAAFQVPGEHPRRQQQDTALTRLTHRDRQQAGQHTPQAQRH